VESSLRTRDGVDGGGTGGQLTVGPPAGGDDEGRCQSDKAGGDGELAPSAATSRWLQTPIISINPCALGLPRSMSARK
jgi:hypothetical protein